MQIGFWGSGNMARVLGGAWSITGHQVAFGSRHLEKSQAVAEEIGPTTMFATGNALVTPGFITAPRAEPRFGERRKGTY
ncbi:NAD(P)-binding domain-containing protein [Oscillatoria sp. CS-180]|uniref:NAD(P)-binding domain-containing protein n=1 Tax=Oscillatoria sp. CS-180 TaxID=3021720 RepID=UPI003FA68692